MLTELKKIIKKALKAFNLEIVRTNKSTMLFDVDEEFNTLYTLAQDKTQMALTDNHLRRQRHFVLTQLLKNNYETVVKGNVAECGCWRGLSAYQIAYWLKAKGFNNKFFIFDSFEGLSEFLEEDLKGNIVKNQRRRQKEFACSLNDVQRNLKEFDFIEYKKGWIPERFLEVDDLKFSFVHIDVDLYKPIKNSLEFFYPRVIKNGIIVFDDYGYPTFPGAKLAVDEFIYKTNDLFFLLPAGGAFIIKNK